jgi:hypothetical protein
MVRQFVERELVNYLPARLRPQALVMLIAIDCYADLLGKTRADQSPIMLRNLITVWDSFPRPDRDEVYELMAHYRPAAANQMRALATLARWRPDPADALYGT